MRRIFHTWDKWECYPAGLYEDHPPDGMTAAEAVAAYATFLRDTPRFERALAGVVLTWVHSCEQYLTNEQMNRIAWLGQASMCYATGVPACFRAGFHRLTEPEQREANATAGRWLDIWRERHLQTRGDTR